MSYGSRVWLRENFRRNAGVVGKDPMVSGQFQHGASSASSPPPDVNARLHERLKRSSTAVAQKAARAFGSAGKAPGGKSLVKRCRNLKAVRSRVVRASIARGPARQVTQSGRLKTKYTRLRHFAKARRSTRRSQRAQASSPLKDVRIGPRCRHAA